MTKNSYEQSEESNRAAGILLGLACGDALGRPVEFKSSGWIDSQYGTLTEMVGSGTHDKPPGTVTDDTELAICIAHSLVTQEAFNPADVAERFLTWHNSGPFDAGLMTMDSLRQLEANRDWHNAGKHIWQQSPEGKNAGNGSLMRCAPYAIAFRDDPQILSQVSRVSSRITHADPRCTYGCAILNQTLAGILRDEDDPLEATLEAIGEDVPEELKSALEPVPNSVRSADLRYNGYVISTLQSALYHGLTANDPRTAIANAVSMGQDADTVGAVTGAIVGARFGADALPDSWLQTLTVEPNPHGRGSQHRTWVDDWIGQSLTTRLENYASQIVDMRDSSGFSVSEAIDRSQPVNDDD